MLSAWFFLLYIPGFLVNLRLHYIDDVDVNWPMRKAEYAKELDDYHKRSVVSQQLPPSQWAVNRPAWGMIFFLALLYPAISVWKVTGMVLKKTLFRPTPKQIEAKRKREYEQALKVMDDKDIWAVTE